MMDVTEQARRSDALYYSGNDGINRRWLCDKVASLEAENAKLREEIECLQPKDCEGNVLDIADTVSMLRSEYDGDHEWDDVVVELALTKWGGDRWIVRGSKGEAWACDCTKTGYDEDAYEGSDDAEPIVNPTLIEAENAKLREKIKALTELASIGKLTASQCTELAEDNAKLRELVRALVCATDPHDRERLIINAAELLGELEVEVDA